MTLELSLPPPAVLVRAAEEAVAGHEGEEQQKGWNRKQDEVPGEIDRERGDEEGEERGG